MLIVTLLSHLSAISQLVDFIIFNRQFHCRTRWFNDCVAALIINGTTEPGKHFMYFSINVDVSSVIPAS